MERAAHGLLKGLDDAVRAVEQRRGVELARQPRGHAKRAPDQPDQILGVRLIRGQGAPVAAQQGGRRASKRGGGSTAVSGNQPSL